MRVNLKDHIAPGTGRYTFFGWLMLVTFGPLIILATIVFTYGIALIGWIIAGLLYSYNRRKAVATLHGSALLVTAKQFPEIFHAAELMSAEMGMAECPVIYIVESNQQNAFALKYGSQKFIILLDDIVYGMLANGNEKVLQFIIAHELAHHALGHTGFFRRQIASKYKPLSRLDEFSCDAVANAVIGDLNAAQDALAVLLVGPQLFQRVNRLALEEQAQAVVTDKHTKKAEKHLTHPMLLRRYARLQDSSIKP